jgi:hypothetical protein
LNNHYVPRKYLRGFCQPGSDRTVWQYDKLLDKFAPVSVANAANENGFYSDDVEAKLADLIENPANVVIDKLRAGHAIADDDRARLAIYIARYRHVPRQRTRTNPSV